MTLDAPSAAAKAKDHQKRNSSNSISKLSCFAILPDIHSRVSSCNQIVNFMVFPSSTLHVFWARISSSLFDDWIGGKLNFYFRWFPCAWKSRPHMIVVRSCVRRREKKNLKIQIFPRKMKRTENGIHSHMSHEFEKNKSSSRLEKHEKQFAIKFFFLAFFSPVYIFSSAERVAVSLVRRVIR